MILLLSNAPHSRWDSNKFNVRAALPVWAMLAMAVSVTAIFFDSLCGRPSLFFQAILSVGKPAE